MSRRTFLQIQKNSSKFTLNLYTWIQIGIRILKANPDPAAQINADPIRIWIHILKADPDPAAQNNADPDPKPLGLI
jgi:hypothetical protein